MKAERINQLIAEHCPEKFGVHKESGEVFRWLDEEGIHIETIDFCSDLNAMHEAEKILTEEQVKQYRWKLEQGFLHWPTASVLLLFATATQRAEAFLRTIGKWEEE